MPREPLYFKILLNANAAEFEKNELNITLPKENLDLSKEKGKILLISIRVIDVDEMKGNMS